MRTNAELKLRLLEGGVHALRADLRIRAERSPRDRCAGVIEREDARGADDAHNALRLSRAQADSEVHIPADAPKRDAERTTRAGVGDSGEVHSEVRVLSDRTKRREAAARRIRVG